MSKLIFLTLILVTSCQSNKNDIESFFKKLNILVTKKQTIRMNILNKNTTRTVSGGSYVPVETTNCSDGHCKIVPLKDYGIGADKTKARTPVLKYEPNHPDANKDGYVAYPNIIVEEEKIKLERVEMAISFLLKEMPVKHNYFFSEDSQWIFSKYPGLKDFNFKKLLDE